MATSSLVFKLEPFKAGAPLVDQLTAERLNAMLAAIAQCQISFGANISGTRLPSGVILRAKPQGGSGGGGVPSPFLVQRAKDNSVPPYPVLKLYPGRIANKMPTLGGVPLDQDPAAPTQPWLYYPGEDFQILLKVQIDRLDPSSDFQSNISEVKVIASTDEDEVSEDDLDDGGSVFLQSVFWEGETPEEIETKARGHFFILVADVSAEMDDDGNIVVTNIQQWLFDNYTTFAIVGDQAVIIL